jgi:hypothetical protein
MLHIKNLAGGMIDIPYMSIGTPVRAIKNTLSSKLKLPYGTNVDNSIVLTKMDNSQEGFVVLANDKTLGDYGIINDDNEINLVVNTPILTRDASRTQITSLLKDGNSLETVPPNTTVVRSGPLLTPEMVDKIIYIVSPTDNTKGLECRVHMVGPIIPSRVSYYPDDQRVQLEVIKKRIILTFSGNANPYYTSFGVGRIRLLDDSVKGGRRRKRSNRSKRRLMKKRRTRRK